MTSAGVPVVALQVMGTLILSSAIVRAADISVKADNPMAEFDGKTWDDYQQRVLAHLDARGLLDVHMQAVRGLLTVISNGTPEEKALYPSLSPAGRRSLIMVYNVHATRVHEEDYPAGFQEYEDIGLGGSGGVARSLFDSPAMRELQDVLGGDDVQVGAIYLYNMAEAKKVKQITDRMDLAWAQTVDSDTNTIKLREWVAVTKCLHRVFTHNAVPAVVALVAKVNKICGVGLFI